MSAVAAMVEGGDGESIRESIHPARVCESIRESIHLCEVIGRVTWSLFKKTIAVSSEAPPSRS
jgi:hypothetical protein